MSPPMLEVRSVSMDFRGLRALSSVDFDVEEGSITGIIGPNGAGKTTLFNVLTGNYRPTTGRITFQGADITGLPPNRICRTGIARTYQSVRLFSGLSVVNNVKVAALYGRGNGRRESARVDEEVFEILEFTALLPKADKRGEELIPLERKKLEVARALATGPRLMLLDEVVAGLTPNETTEMMATIEAIRGRGITVLLIEHVMKAVMGLSSRIVVLHHGEKIAEGDPEEVSRDAGVIAAYLGTKQ